MPLPVPKKNETKDNFVSRCMSDKTCKKEFPNDKQRVAVCMNLFEDKQEA